MPSRARRSLGGGLPRRPHHGSPAPSAPPPAQDARGWLLMSNGRLPRCVHLALPSDIRSDLLRPGRPDRPPRSKHPTARRWRPGSDDAPIARCRGPQDPAGDPPRSRPSTSGWSGFGNAACCGRRAPLHQPRPKHRRRRLGGVGAAWQIDAVPRRPQPNRIVRCPARGRFLSYVGSPSRMGPATRTAQRGTIVITRHQHGPDSFDPDCCRACAVDADLLEHYDRVQRHENALAAAVTGLLVALLMG
jgi:hypothetical protein